MKKLTISIVVDGYVRSFLDLDLSNVAGRSAFKGQGPGNYDINVTALTPEQRAENIVDSLVEAVTDAHDTAKLESEWKPS